MVLFPNTSRISDCHTVSSDDGTRDEVREKQFASLNRDLHSESLSINGRRHGESTWFSYLPCVS